MAQAVRGLAGVVVREQEARLTGAPGEVLVAQLQGWEVVLENQFKKSSQDFIQLSWWDNIKFNIKLLAQLFYKFSKLIISIYHGSEELINNNWL